MNLKKQREKMGISQRQLAIKMNIPPQNLNRYETGINEPNIKTLIQLADFFNISIDELLERDTEILNLKYLDETRKKLIKEILEMNDNTVSRLDAFYEGLKLAESDRQEIMKRLKGGKND